MIFFYNFYNEIKHEKTLLITKHTLKEIKNKNKNEDREGVEVRKEGKGNLKIKLPHYLCNYVNRLKMAIITSVFVLNKMIFLVYLQVHTYIFVKKTLNANVVNFRKTKTSSKAADKMEDVKLVERMMVLPETPTPRRRVFLSNIDLTLVAYQESVSFFDPPANQMSLSEAFHRLCRAISHVLVSYDFLAGRLVPSLEASNRLEIDCNNAGFVVAAATTKTTLSQLGELMAPKPEFERLVAFLREEAEDELELKDKPLGFFQVLSVFWFRVYVSCL